ncbi:MAG: two-component system, OmpR family, sensor kinase [Solirubrobacteraceae bacterium]|jgi:signal transduction histidine kinase|nr:two-component system, OmpR family, sensor kinase [Solirubrobacteraceae bacterium]
MILLVAVGATFVAIYSGTGAEVRRQIDQELRHGANAFARAAIPPEVAAPERLLAAARRYVHDQPFSASARILFASVAGAETASNEPEVLGLLAEPGESPGKQAVEDRQAQALRRARVGYSTVRIADVGAVRLFVRRLRRTGRPLVTIGVAEPLQAVDRAQHGVARTFAIAGTLTLLAALLASYLLAARLARPLRRIAAIAARVDAGDLTPRIAARGSRDEIRILADAFDHMLDRLEGAFDRQRTFLSDASHELRTPLTVIRGQIEVLARQDDFSPADVRRVEKFIRVEIERMQRLVDDLLLLAQADEHEFLHLKRFGIEPYARELFDGVRNTANRRFELDAQANGHLQADPDRLAQALRNLLANAVEHTDIGGWVRLSVHGGTDYVSFLVEDDGPGIPANERTRVFDRFHRAPGSRTRDTGGAGLGLAIVKAIIDAHGGDVQITGTPGGGTSVALRLPRLR